MEAELVILKESGLRFFGKMSAANAHEIKNALAVINENAGLLEDLVLLAEKGAPLDPERLKRLAQQIKRQVSRADEIAKSTNRFAHSVDNTHGPADLGQSMQLVKTMAMRFATKRHIGIEVAPPQPAITLHLQPFMLLHLLWVSLQFAMSATNAEKTIRISAQRQNKFTQIRYGPLSHLDPSKVKKLATTAEMSHLLQLLNSQIQTDPQTDDLVLIFN